MGTECEMGSQEESLLTQGKQDEAQPQASKVSEDSEPRHERDLSKVGFPPVWTNWGGYPGEIPDDIREWLGDDGRRGEYRVLQTRELGANDVY